MLELELFMNFVLHENLTRNVEVIIVVISLHAVRTFKYTHAYTYSTSSLKYRSRHEDMDSGPPAFLPWDSLCTSKVRQWKRWKVMLFTFFALYMTSDLRDGMCEMYVCMYVCICMYVCRYACMCVYLIVFMRKC